MRLYVNGLPVASGPYDGMYTPPSDGKLRIGFADAGVGSLKLDVAEVTAYDRRWTRSRSLRRRPTCRCRPASGPLSGRRWTLRRRGDTPPPSPAYRALMPQAGLPPAYRAAARLGLAQALRAAEPVQAAQEYAALVDGADVPDRLASGGRRCPAEPGRPGDGR